MEAQVKASDAVPAVDMASGVDGPSEGLSGLSFLEESFDVVGRGLYYMHSTSARVLTIPVRIPLRKMWLIGMAPSLWWSDCLSM